MRDVVTLVWDGLSPFEFGVACEVFGVDRSDDGGPVFDFAVAAVRPGPVSTDLGFEVGVRHGLDRAASADLLIVTAHTEHQSFPAPVLAALRAAVDRGARVLSLCSGAFALGEAGLLDGRRCTTHWRYAAELQRRFPAATVDPDVLYVDEDPVITSAGTAAGLDACLHLLRKEFGAQTAARVARRMVVAPHRDGGQAQFVRTPVPQVAAQTLAPLIAWARQHLAEDLSVPVLSRQATMSARTFARRFREETGTTPHHWVLTERLRLAEHLLETTDAAVEEVAARSGFGTASVLRHHFVRARRTTPSAYRARFRGATHPDAVPALEPVAGST